VLPKLPNLVLQRFIHFCWSAVENEPFSLDFLGNGIPVWPEIDTGASPGTLLWVSRSWTSSGARWRSSSPGRRPTSCPGYSPFDSRYVQSTGPIEKTITDPESAYFYRYLEMLHTFQGEFLFFLLFHGQPPLKKLGKNGLCPGGARFGPEGVHFMKTSLGGTCRGISWAAFLKRVSNLVQASARCSLCSCSDQGKQFRSALTLILEKEKNVTNIICRPVLHGVRTVDLSEIEGRGAKLQRFWVRAPKKTWSIFVRKKNCWNQLIFSLLKQVK